MDWYESLPTVLNHIYWASKKQFLLSEDLYEDWVVFAVEEGTFRFEIGAAEGSASGGDLVLCPPGIPFRRETVSPLSFHYLVVDWGMPREEALETVPAGKISILDKRRLASTFAYLRRCAGRGRAGRPDRWASRLFQDMLVLYGLERELESETDGPRGSGEDRLIEQAAREIRRLAFGALSLGELAASVGLSPVQLTRRFQACYGCTPSAYLRAIRLERACRLLADTSLPLEQIAERCGYESGFYLSRVFSRQYKTSPSEFRRTHRL